MTSLNGEDYSYLQDEEKNHMESKNWSASDSKHEVSASGDTLDQLSKRLSNTCISSHSTNEDEKLASMLSSEALKDFPEAKKKLDELFFLWLSKDSTVKYFEDLISLLALGKNVAPESQVLDAEITSTSFPSNMNSLFSPRSPRQHLHVNVNTQSTGVRSPPRSPRSPPRSPRSPITTKTVGNLSLNLISPISSTAERKQKQKTTVFNFDEKKIEAAKKLEIPVFYKENDIIRIGGSKRTEDSLENRLNEVKAHFKNFPKGIQVNDFVGICKRILIWHYRWEKENKNGEQRTHSESKYESNEKEKAEDELDNEEKREREKNKKKEHDSSDSLLDDFVAEEKRADDLLDSSFITLETFCKFWQQEMAPYDEVERFFRLVKKIDSNYIVGQDFAPFLAELLTYHPGLAFLAETPEFQGKYAKTVIARIMYSVNKSWNGRISHRELRNSDLLKVCHLVDMEKDINTINRYFSYEHFYVLYCKFWELDTDHDFELSKDDLMRHGGHALTRVIVDRIFTVLGTINLNGEDINCPKKREQVNTIGYEEFVFFFLSEEDKTNPTSLRFWFRCVDIDGDGVIRPWEMKYFYDHQLIRMQSYSHEVVPFADILCQMHDCLVPKTEGEIVLKDFLHPHRIKISGVLFNVLFNLNKFIAFEQRDPFIIRQQLEQPGLTDWDRYANNEYGRLAQAEEQRELEESCELSSWESEKVGF